MMMFNYDVKSEENEFTDLYEEILNFFEIRKKIKLDHIDERFIYYIHVFAHKVPLRVSIMDFYICPFQNE